MKLSKRKVWKLAAALAIAVAVLACGRDDDQRVSTTPPATMPGPGGMMALRVVDVDVGNAIGPDKRIVEADEDDEFRPTDTIYASVATDGTAPNAALVTRWTFEDGQVVEETTETIAPKGPTITEFHVSKPSGWPEGKYRVDVLLNGSQVDSEDFTIKKR